jgi:hypothetical protein
LRFKRGVSISGSGVFRLKLNKLPTFTV